jgi:basic amino acid/polyamine antiporter, APA family
MEKKQGQLVRSVTLLSATMLVVSSVIGSGVYKKVVPMSNELMSPDLVMAAWVLGGIISLFGALSNAEIASMMADSGGEYVYFRRIYGKFMAFLWGWSTFAVIKTAAISGLSYVFAQSLNSIITFVHDKFPMFSWLTPLGSGGIQVLAICLILVLTFINTRGLRGAELLSKYVTYFVIVGLSGIVICGLLFGGGAMENVATPSVKFVQRSWTDPGLIKAMFAALLAAFWGYEGWNTVGFIGGEIKNPNRNLPLALMFGLSIIIGAYMLVNFTYHYILPIDTLMATGKNEIAAIAVVRHFASDWGVLLLSIVICLTTLGCTNSTVLMPPRIYWAMAKDNLFFPKANFIDPKYNTPNNAIWMQGAWACVLVLSGSFDQLTDMLIFAAFFFYGATAFGVFILRKREPDAERPYKVWGYPFVPAIFVIFCIALIIITCINRPHEAAFGILLMLTGVPFYCYWQKVSVFDIFKS